MSCGRGSFARVRVLTSFDAAAIEDLLHRDEFFWLDLERPQDDQIDELGRLLDLHPLVVEDNKRFDQRPKLDDFERYAFVVFYGVRPGEERIELLEFHLLISGSYVVTIHRAPCTEIDELREALERDPRKGEQFIVYRIFDTLTDSFFPVLSSLDEEIDRIEDEVVQKPTDEQLQRIFGLKRNLVAMRRVVTPERDLFARAFDEITSLPGLEPSSHDYFRDVYDHLIRISDQIDSYRDLLTGAMDVYLSTVSNRLNAVMKQLTIIATIFLPLSFVTGFFGQNFGWLVRHIDTFGAFVAFGLGGILLPAAMLLTWFRRSGYF
jgi:magnesium transporter